MPSLSGALSKLHLGKHRKSASTSSNPSDHTSSNVSNDAIPVPPTPASPIARQHQRDEGVVVIDRERDHTGHRAPFTDQRDRPELPTTSSNVHNPVPSSPVNKTLPPIPASRNEDTQSSAPRLPEIPSLPPLPHISSIDREQIHQAGRERPKAVVSASQVLEDEDASALDARRFQHVQASTSPLRKDPRVMEGLDDIVAREPTREQSFDRNVRPDHDLPAVPSRGASRLHAEHDSTNRGSTAITSKQSSHSSLIDRLRPSRNPDIDSSEHLQRHLAHLSLFPDQITTRPNTLLRLLPSVNSPPLEVQRDAQVQEIILESKARKAQQPVLTEFGRDVFRVGRIEHVLGTPNTVEVHTRWLEPVIQEHVRPFEHTEFFTVINRDIHKYHVYPKIQPIADPNPIPLKPRHRIFSSLDNEWHEVIGDEAAIEILGEDVFLHGKKTHREDRGMALPGLGGVVTKFTGDDVFEAGQDVGLGRVIEREGIVGQHMGPWHELGRLNLSGLGIAADKIVNKTSDVTSDRQKYSGGSGDGQKTVGVAF